MYAAVFYILDLMPFNGLGNNDDPNQGHMHNASALSCL